MKLIYHWFLFLFITPLTPNICANENEFKGEWSGIEVMGVDSYTASKIRQLIPIKKGTPFSSADSEHKSWCNKIKNNFPAKDIKCAFIGYENKKFFYDVEITPKNEKDIQFRQIPNIKLNSHKVPVALSTLLSEYNEKIFSMIASDNFPFEMHDKGYIDHNDSTLHAIVEKLVKYVENNNLEILEIIRYATEKEEREKAAQLLSWSKSPNKLAYIIEWDLLNDPDEDVRNDLSRSLYISLDHIKDNNLLRKALSVYCKQASLHSHTDRNKALSSIQKILKKHPTLNTSINAECYQTIKYIADTSILINSGGIAQNILEQIKGNSRG